MIVLFFAQVKRFPFLFSSFFDSYSFLGFEPSLPTTPGVLNHIGECMEGNTGQCRECEGDCDEDADCMGGLVCFQREDGESIPGCTGGSMYDIEGKDYCAYCIFFSISHQFISPWHYKVDHIDSLFLCFLVSYDCVS